MPKRIVPGILKGLGELFRSGTDQVFVEIGERFVSAVSSRATKDGRAITGLARLPVAQGSDATVSDTVKELVASLPTGERSVRLMLGRHLVAVRFLRLPSVDPGEIARMAKAEAIKYLPSQTEDEPVVGCRVIESSADGYSNVLVAMAQPDMVGRAIGILFSAGLEVRSICLGSEALFLWSVSSGLVPQDGAALVVNAAAEHVDTIVADGSRLVFTRGVALSSDDPLYVAKALKEISSSAAAYRRESSADIPLVVITGSRELSLALSGPVECEAIARAVVADQRDGASFEPQAPDIDEDASFAEMLGLAVSPDGAAVELLPDSAREDADRIAFRRELKLAFALAACAALLIFGIFLKKIHDKSVQLASINAQRARLASDARVARGAMKEMALIEDIFGSQSTAIDIVSAALKAAPAGISLNTLEAEPGKVLVVRGSSPELAGVFRYVKEIGSSGPFSDARVKYATRRAGSGGAVDFEIVASLSAKLKGRARPDAAK